MMDSTHGDVCVCGSVYVKCIATAMRLHSPEEHGTCRARECKCVTEQKSDEQVTLTKQVANSHALNADIW